MTPRPEVTKYVGNQSGRGGVKPRIIVLHTTESHDRLGIQDINGIISWFNNPASQASSHVVNDKDGNDARLVPDSRKAWTQASFNPQSLSIEQIAFAKYDTPTWKVHRKKQLANTAAWIAYWSKKYDIPIRRSTTHGVCEHSSLGLGGGGHHDCGPGYPFDYVLSLAANINPRIKKEAKWREELRRLRAKAERRRKAGRTRWTESMKKRAEALKKALNRK